METLVFSFFVSDWVSRNICDVLAVLASGRARWARWDVHLMFWKMKRGFNFLDYVDDRGTSSSSNVDSNVDVALAGVQALGQYVSPIRMPWESTSLMRQVLKKESLPWLKPVKVPKNFTAVSFNMVQSKEVILLEKKIAIRERSYVVVSSRPADDRDQVLLKWLEVILICPEESKVGRQLLADELAAVSEERHLQIMADSLRKKSTRTLEIRIASLLLYVKWHRSNHASEPFLPFKEEWVYDYLCDLRDKACSASRGTTFISTLSFVKQTVGMSGIQECVESARVSGAALSMYLTKRPLKQAPPLEPTMLAVLELACFFESDAYLRCMAGFCLVCIYGRMRVSDVSRLVNLSVIGKFAEASLMRVKTSRSREKQTTFLPSIIPVEGVLGFDWFGAFILNRRHLGLEEFPALESRGFERSFVVLPSEDSLHLADYNKVKTSEVTSKMRIILGKFFPPEDVAALTSHSLKTTVLTYVSIHGIDYVFSELLGYHLTSHRSAINYQRDALSAPIRAMCDILSKVKTGDSYHWHQETRFSAGGTRKQYVIRFLTGLAISLSVRRLGGDVVGLFTYPVGEWRISPRTSSVVADVNEALRSRCSKPHWISGWQEFWWHWHRTSCLLEQRGFGWWNCR